MKASAPHNAPETSQFWEPRRTVTLAAARRHTARVKMFRLIMMGLAAALIVLLSTQFFQSSTLELPVVENHDAVRMVNPRYSGRTTDGVPYVLTSAEAVQTDGSDNFVELVEPVLQFYRDNEAGESTIVAKSGTFDDSTKILNLVDSVELTTDDGNHCLTTHARIDTTSKEISGDDPISCSGKFGKIDGNAFEIIDSYQTFIFKNGMMAELEQSGANDAGKTEQE